MNDVFSLQFKEGLLVECGGDSEMDLPISKLAASYREKCTDADGFPLLRSVRGLNISTFQSKLTDRRFGRFVQFGASVQEVMDTLDHLLESEAAQREGAVVLWKAQPPIPFTTRADPCPCGAAVGDFHALDCKTLDGGLRPRRRHEGFFQKSGQTSIVVGPVELEPKSEPYLQNVKES